MTRFVHKLHHLPATNQARFQIIRLLCLQQLLYTNNTVIAQIL